MAFPELVEYIEDDCLSFVRPFVRNATTFDAKLFGTQQERCEARLFRGDPNRKDECGGSRAASLRHHGPPEVLLISLVTEFRGGCLLQTIQIREKKKAFWKMLAHFDSAVNSNPRQPC